MVRLHQPNRIGDILIERGIISRTQLLHALDFQQARQLMLEDLPTRGDRQDRGNELGEILIELGFITRDQLKKNLARQSRLRKTTLVVSFVAPLFTMACGGGASTSPANKPAQQTTSSLVVESQAAKSVSSTPPQSPMSSTSSSSSSKATQSSSAVQQSSPQAGSSQTITSAQQSSGQQSSVAVHGPVVLYWTAPTRRLNGEHLDITEIGGYEVRYKLSSDAAYQSITIPDAFTDSYYFDYLEGNYEFEIAAYDVGGLYSDFVAIEPIQ